MSTVANIVDGKVTNANSATTTTKTASESSGMDKEAFLQLLVAQMKYQDPLEPTSNTEYVSQYATFSQVEQLQNMASSMDQEKAAALVGKYVTMKTDTGNASGMVDYVEYSGGKTLLYINGNSYSLDKLETVWGDDYLQAYDLCNSWAKSVNELPATDKLTLDYADAVEALRAAYDGMTSYQKSFIGSSLVQILKDAENKIASLRAAADTSDEEGKKPEDEETEPAKETTEA